ncbi:hypothetical protein Gogos_003381, partial [Gossypium gossypioides]|nr:hypothetical protein [Gossypium gossypioides]
FEAFFHVKFVCSISQFLPLFFTFLLLNRVNPQHPFIFLLMHLVSHGPN